MFTYYEKFYGYLECYLFYVRSLNKFNKNSPFNVEMQNLIKSIELQAHYLIIINTY